MKKQLVITAYSLLLIFLFNSCNQEKKDFDQARNSDSVAELKSFIASYPGSSFADSAEILIEDIIWGEKLLEHTTEGYKDYLSNYPEGRFADSAKYYIETPFIIKGVLVDSEGNVLKGKSMTVYLANEETTVDTHQDEEQKPGIGKQIKGPGTLVMSVKGVEGGGALKLVDEGGIINPGAKTDDDGNFEFSLSGIFVEGESELLITVEYQSSNFITESYPIVDKEGNPLILKIDSLNIVNDLGEVRTLKE